MDHTIGQDGRLALDIDYADSLGEVSRQRLQVFRLKGRGRQRTLDALAEPAGDPREYLVAGIRRIHACEVPAIDTVEELVGWLQERGYTQPGKTGAAQWRKREALIGEAASMRAGTGRHPLAAFGLALLILIGGLSVSAWLGSVHGIYASVGVSALVLIRNYPRTIVALICLGLGLLWLMGRS